MWRLHSRRFHLLKYRKYIINLVFILCDTCKDFYKHTFLFEINLHLYVPRSVYKFIHVTL